MIKQQMTPERKARVYKSVQFMAVMAELIKIEYQCDMDARFKNPLVNQFAGRIVKDANAILTNLAINQNVNIRFQSIDYIEGYACELHRVFHFFVGLPVDQIKEVMDNIYAVSEKVEDDQSYK